MKMMLRTQNTAGTFIYPQYKTGQLDAAHEDKSALHVFVPDGSLPGGDWVCTIEGEHGAVIISTREDLYRLMIALEIAWEKVKTADLPHEVKS
jgi:hypothetical protein